MAYAAIVARIQSVKPHENADRIQLAKVLGEQVVVGLDVNVGDLGIYFPVDGQLSHEFCVANGLYNTSAHKKLGTAPTDGKVGFFDVHRRVRAQSFRGAKSEGFWIPFHAGATNPLHYCYDGKDYGSIADGVSFTAINRHEICNKYETQATRNARANQSKSAKRGETLMFKKHADTDQFRHKWEEIPEGSIIYLTEKLHGTSGRYGHVKDEPVPSFVGMVAARIAALLGYKRDDWTYLHGTRNVILGQTDGEGFYGSDQFRTDAVKGIELHKGEVLYFELVGDTDTNTPIMGSCKVDQKELPEIYAQYGDQMVYRYGCKFGECKLYVYRIVQMNEDGQSVELSWPQVKKRCAQLNLQHVPEIGIGDFDPCDDSYGMRTCGIWHKEGAEQIKKWIEDVSHGPSLLDHSHIREGVAIRIDTPDGKTYTLKEKSFEFKFLEGIVKSANVVDIEEAS